MSERRRGRCEEGEGGTCEKGEGETIAVPAVPLLASSMVTCCSFLLGAGSSRERGAGVVCARVTEGP